MHCAGQNDCLEVVKVVFDAYPGAIHVTDHEGGLPLHHACCFAKNVEVVKFIYEANTEAISIKQMDGITPMHLAASQNDSPELLRLLLQLSPNAAAIEDNEGWVALRCIADRLKVEMSSRRLECFRILLNANPAAASQIGTLEERDIVSRLSLNAFPSINLQLYRELNWIARRQQLFLMVQFARDPLVMQIVASPTSSQLRNVELTPIVALMRLCQHYISHNSWNIPAGILRKILKFI
jgi:ankyrin repeat protein